MDTVKGFFTAQLSGDVNVPGLGVFFRIKGDKGQPEIGAGLHNSDGDFAPVGNEYFIFLNAHGLFVSRLEYFGR